MSLVRSLIVVVSLSAFPASAWAQMDPPANRLTDSPTLQVADRIVDTALVREFYAARNFQPAWTGLAAAQADKALILIAAAAEAEGLQPQSYALPDGLTGMDRDLLITDSLSRFIRDMSVGRVAASRQMGGMAEIRKTIDAAPLLTALAGGNAPQAVLAPLQPGYAGYHRLKTALAHYRKIAAQGGWPTIPDGPSMKPGADDVRMTLLRKRLIAAGELDPALDLGLTLDDKVSAALKRFQIRHGIDPDGAVGRQTLTALNVTAEDRIRQIAANMERWRWMPRRLDDNHIAVNLPAAHLELVRNGQIAMAMRVVVGDLKHQTPPMATSMTAVVINPTWTVPPSIATKEILPKLRKDPSYLVTNNMRILDAFDNDFEKSQGLGIDWSKYSKLPYRLRQKPGIDNALGQVKFALDNNDDIYLHDTPKRQYFGRIFRALSHGCVRLERPEDLARALLPPEQGAQVAEWTGDDTTRTLRLEQPLAVYLMYMTAWADDDGTVHFREDLYGHDGRLKAALKRRSAPASAQVAQGAAR